MKKLLGCFLCVMFLVFTASGVSATALTLDFENGNLAAEVTFDTSGTDLIVTLSNTGYDVLNPGDILQGVFFTLNGDPDLTPVSAILNSGSIVLWDPDGQPAAGNVGGEWGYQDGIAAYSPPISSDEGIYASGLGLPGVANFNGPNLDGPDALDGMQYGIISQNDNIFNGNPQVTPGSQANPFIQYSVVFTLSGLPEDFDPSTAIDRESVFFQYGTSWNTYSVPEPATMLLLGSGLLGLALFSRNRFK